MPTTSRGAPYPAPGGANDVPVELHALAQWATDELDALDAGWSSIPGAGISNLTLADGTLTAHTKVIGSVRFLRIRLGIGPSTDDLVPGPMKITGLPTDNLGPYTASGSWWHADSTHSGIQGIGGGIGGGPPAGQLWIWNAGGGDFNILSNGESYLVDCFYETAA